MNFRLRPPITHYTPQSFRLTSIVSYADYTPPEDLGDQLPFCPGQGTSHFEYSIPSSDLGVQFFDHGRIWAQPLSHL